MSNLANQRLRLLSAINSRREFPVLRIGALAIGLITACTFAQAADLPSELPPLRSTGQLALSIVEPVAKQIGRYEKLELTLRDDVACLIRRVGH